LKGIPFFGSRETTVIFHKAERPALSFALNGWSSAAQPLGGNPGAVRNLGRRPLTAQYINNHKEETIAAAIRVAEVSRSVAAINHQELMPVHRPALRIAQDVENVSVIADNGGSFRKTLHSCWGVIRRSAPVRKRWSLPKLARTAILVRRRALLRFAPDQVRKDAPRPNCRRVRL
jgi:hypothetical protein